MWQPRIMYLERWPQHYVFEEGKEMDWNEEVIFDGMREGKRWVRSCYCMI